MPSNELDGFKMFLASGAMNSENSAMRFQPTDAHPFGSARVAPAPGSVRPPLKSTALNSDIVNPSSAPRSTNESNGITSGGFRSTKTAASVTKTLLESR